MKRCLAVILSLSSLTLAASDPSLIWTAISIPARDGKTLAADLYSADATPQRKPVILIQTPYNKNYYRTDDASGLGGKKFPTDAHYNYVVVDWRGFYGSKGADVPGYDRGLDGCDCVEWIAAQPWCDGKVGTWGSSALGVIQYQTARRHPPHLACITPQVKDFQTLYENYYYGGDYRKEHVESVERLGFLSTAAVLAHPALDATWRAAAANTAMAPDIEVPALVVGGWYDHFPTDVLRSFEDLRTASAPAAREKHRLIVGPWLHTGVGESQQGVLEYPNATDLYSTEIRFWDYCLRGVSNGWDQEPVVSYYQMGENAWRTAPAWTGIPRMEKSLYLQPAGGLSEALPPEGALPDGYIYEPDDPTPALGGSRFNPFDPSVLTGPQDLREAIETRPDVLVYSTPVLEEDLRVNGALRVDLFVSSNRVDTDFCVRLTDVYPDGRSLVMTQGIRRTRFRNSSSTPELMTPGQIYPVTVELQDLALTFLRGHRLRVDVCSADYPHYDKNRNDGGPMYSSGPSYSALNTVYHDAAHASRIVLQCLPNTPLSAGFTWAPSSPEPGGTVAFTASASGGTPPYVCSWNLDGTQAVGPDVLGTFSAGSHAIVLTVTDGAGAGAVSQKTLVVAPSVFVSAVVAMSNPFRLEVSGSGFQEGCNVVIDGKDVPKTAFKGPAMVVAKGTGLKAMVPKGMTVQVSVMNPSGTASAPFPFTR